MSGARNAVVLLHNVTIVIACIAPVLLLSVSPVALAVAAPAAGWWIFRGHAGAILFFALAVLLIIPAGGDDFALRVAAMAILLVAWDLDAVRAVGLSSGDTAKDGLRAVVRGLPVILAGTAVAIVAPIPEMRLTPLAGGILIATAIAALLLFVTRLDAE